MALRLSKSLKEASSKLSGFGLTFTEGVTYNLDELFADKDRDNSNKELVLNVKYETEIKEKVIKRIREEIAYQFTTDISGKEDEIKDKLADVISNAFVKYGCKYPDIPDACKSEINYNMTKYLKSLCTSEDITFFIRFLDIDTVDITYDFEKSDSLKSKLSEYYERYTVLYNKELDVNEGELAITDEKHTIGTNSLDYKKYLLSGEKSNRGYTPLVTTRRPVVVVEEGSEDETTEDDSESIYDEIKKYSQLVEDYKSKILELSDKIEQVKTDIKSDLTIIPKIETTEDGSLNSKWYTLPNTKAVYDFITNYITLTELSNSEMLTENFWNRDFITGTIYHIKDDDTTIVSSDKENNEYKIKIPSYFKIVELPDGTYKAKYEEV